MHSSGMRTARLLTVSQHAPPRGVSACVCVWGGVLCPGGVFLGGYLADTSPGPEADTPRIQTDTCENITFANFVCGR